MKNKHAQAWGTDLTIAIIIFSMALIVFYIYFINNPKEAEETIDSLNYEAKIIGSSIFSEGYPKNWDPGNVVTIGILSKSKINETKLENFYNLAQADYAKTKSLFNTIHEYYFFLNETMDINAVEVDGIGNDPISPKNLIKQTHFTIYQNKPVTAYLYIWN